MSILPGTKKMDNRESTRELVSKGIMGLLVGVALAAAGIWTGGQLHIVWSLWPSTDGVVVSGTVQDTVEVPYSRWGTPIHRFSPQVEFRYTANGTDYRTQAVSVYAADTYTEAAARLIRRYAPGTHHPIRYNPRDPREIRFGTIEFGSLAFSLLLLLGGAVSSVMGFRWLVMAYPQRVERAPTRERRAPAPVLSFSDGSRQEPLAATRRCPSCGRPVKLTEETCPNCLKFLRAA